jgi:threonine dehydrogenase-like Zn-dependent dehydrogenase
MTTDFSGNRLREGDAVAWSSNIPCGQCYWCVVAGERTLWETRKVYGVNHRFDQFPRLSGGWADAIYLQPGSAIFRLPDDLSPEQVIALGCAGPTAVHGVFEVAGITAGDTVVVQGGGPVGIASAMYGQLAGASRVILVGGPPGRVDLAREVGVGDVHVDIFEFPEPDDRVRIVLDAIRVVAARMWCWNARAYPQRSRKAGKWLALAGRSWRWDSTPIGARSR